jgi:hypothetical protein
MRKITPSAGAAALFLFVIAASCNYGGKVAGPPVTFVTKYAPIEFSFPAGWQVNPEQNPYDLQCLSPKNDMNTGVFAYKIEDLQAGSSPQKILQLHIDEIRSKRENFEELEAQERYVHGGKTITAVTYSGDKDNSPNYYRFALVEFENDSDRFAVLLQVSLPEAWKRSKPILRGIAETAVPRKEGNES